MQAQEDSRHHQLETLQRENALKWERIEELYREAAALEEQEEARRLSVRRQQHARLRVEVDPAPFDGEDPEEHEGSDISDHRADDASLPSSGGRQDDLDQRRIQAEIDFLSRSRWATECEEILRLLQRGQGREVEPVDSSSPWGDDREEEDLYSTEIIQSYRNTKEINRVLREEIRIEQENLRQLVAFRDESREINAELVGEKQRLEQEIGDGNAEASSMEEASDGTSPTTDGDALNRQLRSDLSYAAICIEDELLSDPYRDDDSLDGGNERDEETWSLGALILRLVTLLVQPKSGADRGDQDLLLEPDNGSSSSAIDNGEAPYLAVDEHPIRTEHVRLLRECTIVESHNDDENLIRLVDYRR